MSSYLWFLLLLTVTTATSECPQNCTCSPIRNQQTPRHHDHAICNTLVNITENYPKLHSLDLSSNELDEVPTGLNLLQNVTHLDLSKNHLTKLTKLNHRIRSLDLSHNRLTSSEIVKIPPKIRILNLSYNQITRLPLDVMHFKSLKSLNLIGNHIDCSCETLTIRDWLHQSNVWLSKHIICASPLEVRHQPWDTVSKNTLCSIDEGNDNKIELHHRSSREVDLSDFIAEEFLPIDSHNILKRQVPNDEPLLNNDEGSGMEYDGRLNDPVDIGSGEGSGTDVGIDSEAVENISAYDNDNEEEEEMEDGSGGSGLGLLPLGVFVPLEEEEHHTTTTDDPNFVDPPIKTPIELNIFEGNRNDGETTIAPVIEPVVEQVKLANVERIATAVQPPVAGISSPIETPPDSDVVAQKPEESSSTFILLAVIGVLLVCLIGYVIVKRRNNRRRPYDHNDAENAREIEMLDMKKNENGNGKQPHAEIVPLMPKKEQPKIEREMGDPHREINSNIQPLHPTTYPKVDAVPLKQSDVPETTNALPENNNNNLTDVDAPQPRDEIPKPVDEMDDNTTGKPTQNGHNGHTSDDEVFLPQEPGVKRYSPVYSPETGRVKIKLLETPKPKTPIVVTRSRSNAGAYVTTPNLNIRSTSTNGQ